MMNLQYLSISMLLMVLSSVHLHAYKYSSVRQAINPNCPNFNLCDFVQCENGQCIEDKTTAGCYRCRCEAGFTGTLCETAIAPPGGCGLACQNGGLCQQTGTNAPVCACPPDFTGSLCETSVSATHPCVTMPGTVCQNGGTCTINGAGYLCNCPMGWSGTNCLTPDTITTCNSNPCGAHGTCIQAVLPSNALAIFCTCEAQWTGKYCDTNLASGSCTVDYCQSGGTCMMNGNTPFCICPPTHTGQQCETSIAPTMTTIMMTTMTTGGTFTTTAAPSPGRCSSNPCSNGGTCYNTGNNFICLCTPQFTGVTCNMPHSPTTPPPTTASSTNACSPNPCNNGGTCYKHSTGFVCVCSSQYAGATCDTAKTATVPSVTTPSGATTCANQPCQNGGICYTAGSSYFCYCGAGGRFTGKNCESPLATADSSCPLDCSPGYCISTGGVGQNSYACMCDGTLTPTSCSKM